MEYTVTIKATNPYAGSSAASGSYYNISSTDNMNGVSTPRASNITWTFAIPTNIPWAVCKIKSAYVKNVRVYNSSSSVKDASWVFRTNYYGSGWRSSMATVGDAVVWRYHGMNNGSWHPGDTTTTYNNVTMTSNAIKWIQSQFSAGKNLYFSYIEARSAGGSIVSPDYSGATYSTRFYHSYVPSIVITYEMQPCYVFTNKRYSYTYPSAAMTSNYSQSCTASASAIYNDNYPAWRAFDDSTSTNAWATTRGVTSAWLQLLMPKALYDIEVTLTNRADHATLCNGPIAGIIYGSNDNGATLTQIGSFSGRDGATKGASTTVKCTHSVPYNTVRMVFSSWDTSADSAKNECALGDCSIKGYSATAAGSWQVAIPYVYTNSAWTQAVPSVYTSSAWNPG